MDTHRSSKTRLTKLPSEILLQIARDLVPNGNCYYLLGHHGFNRFIITKVGRNTEQEQTRANEFALCRTCWKLRSVSDQILYGENQFIVDVSENAMYVLRSIVKPHGFHVDKAF